MSEELQLQLHGGGVDTIRRGWIAFAINVISLLL